MKVTRATEYAIRCMVYLSTQEMGKLSSRKEISSIAEIPEHFLSKIAQDLAKAGLIKIHQGARGGFSLLKSPQEISMLEVVETMIGEIYLNECVTRPEGCLASYNCAVHTVWLRARDQLRQTLAEVSIADLVKDGACIGNKSFAEIITSQEGKEELN